MLDPHAVNRSLRGIIRTLLGMPANSVRPANQNAPTGTMDEQFATVLVTSVGAEGWDDSRHQNEAQPSTNVAESVTGQRRLAASVQFFRGDAYTQACRLRTLLGTSQAIASLQAAGLGFVSASPARNLTGVIDTYWEERAQIDIELYLIDHEVISTPTYGRFPISVTTPASTVSHEVLAP